MGLPNLSYLSGPLAGLALPIWFSLFKSGGCCILLNYASDLLSLLVLDYERPPLLLSRFQGREPVV